MRTFGYGEQTYGYGGYGGTLPYADAVVNNFEYGGVSVYTNDPTDYLMQIFAHELALLSDEIDLLYDERFIGSATGRQLDHLGRPVGVQRETDETDSRFRKRVKIGYAKASSDTSYETFGSLTLNVLDANPSDVSVEPPTDSGGDVTVRLGQQIIEDSKFTASEIGDMLSDAVAAGHRVDIVEEGTFELSSDTYTPPADTGLTDDAGTTGGTIEGDLN